MEVVNQSIGNKYYSLQVFRNTKNSRHSTNQTKDKITDRENVSIVEARVYLSEMHHMHMYILKYQINQLITNESQ